jgi:hypothetical protein
MFASMHWRQCMAGRLTPTSLRWSPLSASVIVAQLSKPAKVYKKVL